MANAQANKRTPSHIFVWEGTNKNGVKIKGETSAQNANWLRANLRRQGINPKKVYRKQKPLFKPKIKPSDIASFSRQITTMIKSSVPIVQALDMVAESGDNLAMRDLIKSIQADIESGMSFGDAIEKHPKHFDKLFVSLIKAGEQAGTMEDMLEKVATYKEKSEQLKAKIKKAMMYPAIVIVAAVVVSAIMLIFVIPQFKEIFASFGAELPAFTQMVINLSEWLQANWYIPIILVVGAFYAFKKARQVSPDFDAAVDRHSLRLPIMGNILTQSSYARFARTLATMFAAGVPVVEAMDSVAGATGNIVYQKASMDIKDDLSKGVQLNVAMQTQQVFPTLMLQMTRVGEESGRLEEMLSKVADYYEEKVDDLVDTLSKQIEPLIMAVLGVLVGGLVIAMYLPIFKLGAVV